MAALIDLFRTNRYLWCGIYGLAADGASLVYLFLSEDCNSCNRWVSTAWGSVFLLFWPLPIFYPFICASIGRKADNNSSKFSIVNCAMTGLTIPSLWLVHVIYREIAQGPPAASQAGLALILVPLVRLVGFFAGLGLGFFWAWSVRKRSM